MNTAPYVSVSSPARQCISVDLPEPDGPMIAVNLPASKATVTPSRARTSVSPRRRSSSRRRRRAAVVGRQCLSHEF